MADTKLVTLRKDFYALEQGMVRSFLLVGEEKALLIDCGVMPDDFLGLVRSVTQLPLMVALTHADGDHTRNASQFPQIYVHEEDQHLLLRQYPELEDRLVNLCEGEVIDLGGTKLEVLHIPGHTHGSVAFLNRADGWLIPGDSVGYAAVYLFGSHRNLPLYVKSLERLQALDGFTELYPSHDQAPVPAGVINQQLAVCRGIQDGSIQPEEPTAEHVKNSGAKLYKKGDCAIYYAPKN